MLELNEQNVAAYLRGSGKVSNAEVLAQSLSGGVANVVLKVFDTGAGEKIGTDMRSVSQIKRGIDDTRMNAGACFVLKQPLPKFKTSAEWLVDIDRMHVEKDCMVLLAQLLPAGSVPRMLWVDDSNYVLAISCAPPDSLIWKKHLLDGNASRAAAEQAGVLLAMIHSGTRGDPAVAKRFGDTKFFIQQRTEPYVLACAEKFPEFRQLLHSIADRLLKEQICLIHGDFTPKNIFLVPTPGAVIDPSTPFPFDHLLLLDFEVAFYGHPAFDVASLLNHLLLKAFYHGPRWRPFVIAADGFWNSYQKVAGAAFRDIVSDFGRLLLPTLLLARVHGKSPVEYLDQSSRARVADVALRLLKKPMVTLDETIDEVAGALGQE